MYFLPEQDVREPTRGRDAVWEDDIRVGAPAPEGYEEEALAYVSMVGGVWGANTHTGGMGLEEVLHNRCGHICWGNNKWAARMKEEFGVGTIDGQ